MAFFAHNILWYSYPHVKNRQIGYPDTTRENIHVSQYFHDNADKKSLKFYNYIKTMRGENLTYFPKTCIFIKKT